MERKERGMRTPLAALSVALLTVSAAAPAQADTRYFSFNATDRIT
jgi:type II secretory pathway component PulK